MPAADKVLQHRTTIPAIILLTASFKPLCYNEETVQILTYPQDPQTISPLTKHIETKLRALLPRPPWSRQAPFQGTFGSGRRQYAARLFPLSSRDTGRSSSGNTQPAFALLLERQERRLVDLATVAEQFRLTPREKETLQFLLKGLTSKEIAARMHVSPHTVKAFLRLVMSKMQVCTRAGIVGKIVTTIP